MGNLLKFYLSIVIITSSPIVLPLKMGNSLQSERSNYPELEEALKAVGKRQSVGINNIINILGKIRDEHIAGEILLIYKRIPDKNFWLNILLKKPKYFTHFPQKDIPDMIQFMFKEIQFMTETDDKKEKFWLHILANNPECFKHFPCENITKKMCETAVWGYYGNFAYVPVNFQTKRGALNYLSNTKGPVVYIRKDLQDHPHLKILLTEMYAIAG